MNGLEAWGLAAWRGDARWLLGPYPAAWAFALMIYMSHLIANDTSVRLAITTNQST